MALTREMFDKALIEAGWPQQARDRMWDEKTPDIDATLDRFDEMQVYAAVKKIALLTKPRIRELMPELDWDKERVQ